jgi:hypothetical protein
VVSSRIVVRTQSALPNPLPFRKISLRPLYVAEYPIDEVSFQNCVESMAGGEGFIRVLNVPIWDDNKTEPLEITCASCLAPMVHVVSLGWEPVDKSNYIEDTYLFFGDFILYFFFCKHCLRVRVLSSCPIAPYM